MRAAVLGRHARRRARWSSQKPGSCISASSRAICCSSAGGSKIVREQLELVAEARDAGIELFGLYLLRHGRRVGDGFETRATNVDLLWFKQEGDDEGIGARLALSLALACLRSRHPRRRLPRQQRQDRLQSSNNIYVIDPDFGPRDLPCKAQPAWSPNGFKIAFNIRPATRNLRGNPTAAVRRSSRSICE